MPLSHRKVRDSLDYILGVNESGTEVNSNGWDYILGDEGSGFKIGLKGLRAIAERMTVEGKIRFYQKKY